jgi:formylglycine-generating enzyme required for sulfatase activity
LWEFADLASGAAPRRGADGVLEVGIEHGIVFVLIPPGAVRFGFDDEVDPAGSDKYPEQQVGAIFLARHEMSRAQWMRLAREIRGLRLQDGGIIDLRNRSGDERGKPANGVTWHMCHALLRRHGLDLPTEIEWEYACKAGTTTRWNTGSHPRSLVGAANFGDPFPDAWRPQSLAPVFADLRQNDFGLLQMHGNVSEWCKDVAPPYPDTLRAIRGGSWLGDPMAGLSTFRNRATPSNAAREVGLRPARRIQRGG